MDASALDNVISRLKAAGIAFEPGLTASEVATAEARYCVHFPPDLASFLTQALPRGDAFPNWRSKNDESIRDRLEAPLEGILFDVEQNNFWWPAWGDRPAAMATALGVASNQVKAAPVMIPIYSHRYLPELPAEEGNPVFSIVQADVIHYGADLLDYLEHEFLRPRQAMRGDGFKRIAFWSDIVKWNSRS